MALYHRQLRFNPRLTSAARRTPLYFCVFAHYGRFQSAPHFSSEANIKRLNNPPLIFRVSIRASLQQRGEQGFKALDVPDKITFQSAPHFSSEANVICLSLAT